MNNKRIITLGLLLGLSWMGMTARIYHIQVVKRDYYAGLAHKQSVRRSIIAPQRGEIFDRKGRRLVYNAKVDLEFSEGRRQKKRQLKRVAPYGHLAGQVLGNLGRDGYGQLGLEYNQDKILRGVDGWKYARYDVARNYHPGFEEQKQDPVNGNSIVTTIDIDIQKIAERALEKGIKRVEALGGTALILEPSSGDIVAMASYPFYDPNRRSRDDIKGWRNSTISKVYEPGSTFKLITSAAGLEEGLIKPDDLFFAENGTYEINGAVIKDTKDRGEITFTQALAYSSNIVMVKAALELSPKTFYRYIRSFGFGMKTGIALPAEEGGSMKPVNRWSSRTQITLAWGQEIGATPLQVALACAAIANDGILTKPRIIKEQIDGRDGKVTQLPPSKVRRVISGRTASQLRQMMVAVVEEGTAKRIKTDRYTIGGKTGTAEKIDPETGQYVKGRFHSSFVGMVPAEKPVYVCLVLVDEPKKDKHGGSCAAPIFRDIMDRILSQPDNILAARLTERDEADRAIPQSQTELSFSQRLMQTFKGVSKAGADFFGGSKASHTEKVPVSFSAREPLPAISAMPAALKRPAIEAPVKTSSSIDNSSENEFLHGRWRMPDVRFMSLRDAMCKLRDLDIKIEYRGCGQVVRQEPQPSFVLKRGSRCVLYLGWES
jgi:cell division protein FtsI/penicillin-binding protein 2